MACASISSGGPWRTASTGSSWPTAPTGRFQPDAAGVIHSRVFPGLRLPLDAMLRGDLATVLRELQRGLAENAHQTFVAHLAGRAPSDGAAE